MNKRLADSITRLSLSLLEVVHFPTWKHFTFACCKGAVLAVGWRQGFKTHPLAHRFGHRYSSIHSELHCITKLNVYPSKLHRYTFINVAIRRENKLRLSRPCKSCQAMLAHFRISDVWYSTNSGSFARLQGVVPHR